MLRWTLERAGRLVAPKRVVTIVASQHRPWWMDALSDQPAENVVVQPSDRGTATGVLLPLLHVYLADRRAIVALLPCDQYVEDEARLRGTFDLAFALAEESRRIVLLGVTAERADPNLGWILADGPEQNGARRVASFFEKPGPTLARFLYRRNAAWSSFMLVTRADVLLSVYERLVPRLLALLARAVRDGEPDSDTLDSIYAALPYYDFSRDLLQGAAQQLRLLMIPPCGWTDLGTPARVAQWMEKRALSARRRTSAPVRTRELTQTTAGSA